MSFGNIFRDLNVSSLATTRSTASKSITNLFSANIRTIGSLLQYERSPGVWITVESLNVPSTQLGNMYTLPREINSYLPCSFNYNGTVLAVGLVGLVLGDSFLSILTNTNGFYNQQSIPVPPDDLGPSTGSVSLNNTGDILAVGAGNDNLDVGAVWIYANVGGIWTLQGTKITGPGEIGPGAFGTTVSLNGAGNLLAVGCPFDNGNVGSVYIFNISYPSAPVFVARLTGPNIAPLTANFGIGINFSKDGSTLAVGAPGFNAPGSVYVFTKVLGIWTQQAILYAQTGYTPTSLGFTVSLSGDGNILAAGAVPYPVLYYRSPGLGGSWSTGTLIPRPHDYVTEPNLTTTSISLDGNTLCTNSRINNNGVGASWIFTQKSPGNWIQNGPGFVGTGFVVNPGQGFTTLSADGKVAATIDTVSKTSLWVFI
jgi:hypothetical protein